MKSFLRFKSVLSVLLILILGVFTMSSCKEETKKEEKSKEKDEIIISVGEDFAADRFDPVLGYGNHQQHRLTHSSLLKMGTDMKIKGDLAKNFEISEDGLLWILELETNHKFSDGNAVNIDDVIFTYKLLKDEKSAFDLSFVNDIRNEDGKLVFELNEPRSTFVSQLSEIPIVPKEKYDKNYSKNPIGSGPFSLEEFIEGEQVIFKKNEHYHKDIKFNKITFLLLSEDAALAAAKYGALDVLYVPASFSDQKIDNMRLESFKSIDARGIVMPTLAAGAKGKIEGNEVEVGNDVTSDLAIRKALNYGLDRKKIVDLTMKGHGRAAYSSWDDMPWFNEKTRIKDGDIEKAKSILKEAGWEDKDGDGIVEKDGKKASFNLYYASSDKQRGDICLAISENAKNFGIEIVVVSSNWDEIFKKGKANPVLWAGGYHSPYELYLYNSSKMIDTSYNNMSQFSDKTVDKHLEEAITSTNIEKSYESFKKAQWDEDTKTGFSVLASNTFVWICNVDHLFFVANDLDLGEQIVHPHGHGWSIFNDLELWNRIDD